VGEGTRQRQQCIVCFVYLAEASRDTIERLDPVIE
jgi:hypothetical protein